jgi:hypothetical protein
MGTFSEWVRCNQCKKIFLYQVNIPMRGDVCPRCLHPEQFEGMPYDLNDEWLEKIFKLKNKGE